MLFILNFMHIVLSAADISNDILIVRPFVAQLYYTVVQKNPCGRALTASPFHSLGEGFYGQLPFCLPIQVY